MGVGNASLNKVCYTRYLPVRYASSGGNASLNKVCYTIDEIISYHINSNGKFIFPKNGVENFKS